MIDNYGASIRQFLQDLQVNNQRLQQAQQQISSGVRVARASDDPNAVVDIIQTRTVLSSISQVSLNFSRVKTEVDTADQVLTDAIKVVEQARTSGAQGATDLADAAQRQLLAKQVESALSSLVHLAATKVEGRYIFSGDNDQVSPYTIDFTQATPVGAYAGTSSTRQVLDDSGNPLTIARTAQQIFEGTTPGENVFASLMNLRDALLQDNTAAILSAQASVSSALDHLNTEQGLYGKMQNEVAAAINGADQQKARLQVQLSSLEDADAVEAAMELSRAVVQQQAALSSRARLPQTSLFNFLA